MPHPSVSVLSLPQIQAIHDASLKVLQDTGVMVHHPDILKLLQGAGARLEAAHPIAHLPESLVMEALARAGKSFVLHGRDPQRVARFGYGDLVLLSSPGQHRWLDLQTDRLRPPTLQDTRGLSAWATACQISRSWARSPNPWKSARHTARWSSLRNW